MRDTQMSMPLRPQPIVLTKGIKNKCDIWRFWSHKAGNRIVTCYSAWEFENAKRLEADQDVLAWCEQPLKVPKARANGKGYILDFWTHRASGSQEYGEVKPSSQMTKNDEDEWEPKDWPKVKKHIESMGSIAIVVSDQQLKEQAYLLANWERAIGHIARSYYRDDRALRQSIFDLVRKRPPITLGEIESYHAGSFGCEVWAQSMRLYQEGKVSANLDEQSLDRCLKFRPRAI